MGENSLTRPLTRISWNEVCPAGTDVSFQVAVSEGADGPWSYGSALTTAAGTTITSTTGRYARFKVLMTSDGAATPVVNDVQVTHQGTSGSRVTRWTYDQAGNITQQARVADAGTETDVRTYNNLNQLETSSGGWTYQYDLDGNLTEKNNGTAEDCEKWELSWNENSRLVQVKKGVYDATPALVNEFTVDYQYDEVGRMLRRDDGTDVTDYFYDGWDIWKEVTGESVTEYLVPSLGIRSFLRDGELYTLHAHGLSSVRIVTDSEGDVAARIELGAWGETLPGSLDSVPGGLTADFVGSLGVRRDKLTGLSWMRNRWYALASQRFVSRDPIGIQGGVNLYAYLAFNSPMDATDPYGLQPPGGGISLWARPYVGPWRGFLRAGSTECPKFPPELIEAQRNSRFPRQTFRFKPDMPFRGNPITEAGLPQSGGMRYIPPENWKSPSPLPRSQGDPVDRFGNRWRFDPQKDEWDVQLSRQGEAWANRNLPSSKIHGSSGSRYLNIGRNGRITHQLGVSECKYITQEVPQPERDRAVSELLDDSPLMNIPILQPWNALRKAKASLDYWMAPEHGPTT